MNFESTLPKTVSCADQYGDYQTPHVLATQICRLLSERGIVVASVLEPTCGVGNLLLAALGQFPDVTNAVGIEINGDYVRLLEEKLRASLEVATNVNIVCASFFHVDLDDLLGHLPEPILVVGNPPWVTNSALGVLGSKNLPKKSNFQNHVGLEARTGKSNFDISEWMLRKLVEALDGRTGTLAMLCKTAVARKVLTHAWKSGLSLTESEIHPIDSAKSFGAAVDACLLVSSFEPEGTSRECRIYPHFGSTNPTAIFGYHDDTLIADLALYHRWKHLAGPEIYKWRSGVKHDCAKVMEIRREGHQYRNGLGELFELEEDHVFGMLKSSEITKGVGKIPTRRMLVTQKSMTDNTLTMVNHAPKTWDYLERHAEYLDRRASSIYRNRPRFSMFGVGSYTFSAWKVAISGFYKALQFAVVGPHEGKPVVLDDTAYFVPCQTESEAQYVAGLLNSQPAREFFSAYVFWDAKRPITIELLRRLDLTSVAQELGSREILDHFRSQNE